MTRCFSFSSRRLPNGGSALFLAIVAATCVSLIGGGSPVLAQKKRPAAKPAKAVKIAFPPLGAGSALEKDVTLYDVTVVRAGVPMRVWAYVPASASKEKKAPIILIAGAGAPLFHGMKLGSGDQPEHLPWVRAGYVVVAYETDGPLGAKQPTDGETIQAMRLFMRAGGGVANARAALSFAALRVPQADTSRVYTVGHSSAATLAIQVAQVEPKRIKGCIAFAPVTDVETYLDEMMDVLDKAVPGFRSFVTKTSPINHPEKLTCPTFLFHADDDSNVKTQDNTTFASVLESTNKRLTFVRVPTGNHYDSMIQQGIPQAIAWLNAQ